MIKRSGIIPFLICLLLAAALWWGWHLLATPSGADTLVRWALNKYIQADEKSFDAVDGTLLSGMEVQNLHLTNWNMLPKGSTVTIPKLTLFFPSVEWKEARINFENATIKLPLSKEIIASGFYDNYRLGAEFQSDAINIEDIKHIRPSQWTSQITAALKNVQGTINGTTQRFQGAAKFLVQEGLWAETGLSSADTQLIVTMDRTAEGYVAAGQITFNNGFLRTKAAEWNLQESKVIFLKTPEDLSFNLKGSTRIDNTAIDMALQGTRQYPHLTLVSDPPLDETQALLKLFKPGVNYDAGEAELPKKNSMDLTAAFVDYYFFGGSSEAVMDQLKKDLVPKTVSR